MIPKIIHYCWFGRNHKSDFVQRCIESWSFYLKEYDIVEWNEDNFDVNKITFTREAYMNKKWAFVSDYVRAYALYSMGGIYLDTDVEIKNNLNSFLKHGAFSGFENRGFPFTALWGAQKGHVWPLGIMKYYENLNQFELKTNTTIVTDFLVDNYKIDRYNNELQICGDVYIYPSNYFCLNVEQNYAIHHFQASWQKKHKEYNLEFCRTFYRDKFLSLYSRDQMFEIMMEGKILSFNGLLRYFINKVKKKLQ